MGNYYCFPLGCTDTSGGKESTCNAGDSSLISGSGRSPGEGIGYPLQYSWASRVAQLVKNPPAMQETWVQPLGWEDPLEKGNGYPLQYSGLENSMDCIVHGVAKSRTRLSNFLSFAKPAVYQLWDRKDMTIPVFFFLSWYIKSEIIRKKKQHSIKVVLLATKWKLANVSFSSKCQLVKHCYQHPYVVSSVKLVPVLYTNEQKSIRSHIPTFQNVVPFKF